MNPRVRVRSAAAMAALAAVTACTAAIPTFDADAETARWVRLWRTYDLDLVDTLFLPDSTATYLSSEREGLIRGIDGIRTHHRGFGFIPGGAEPANELWLEDVHGEQRGATASVTAVWYFGDRAAPRDSVQRGPVTFLYLWDATSWRIAHVQFGNYE